jgi:hypothetical protein
MTVWKVAQHLDRRTPIGPLTLAEWGIAGVLGLISFVWVKWISPFASFQPTLIVVILIFAPLGMKAYLRGLYEVGLGYRLRGAMRMQLSQRCYRPGAGTRAGGYVLRDPAAPRPARMQLPRRRRRGGDDDAR